MIRKHYQLDLYRFFRYFETNSSFKIKSLFVSAVLFSTLHSKNNANNKSSEVLNKDVD